MLESDRTMFCAGLGLSHDDPFSQASGPVAWDVWGQYHLSAEGLLERPETPYQPGATVDGAPIPLGGRLLAGGLQWSIEF